MRLLRELRQRIRALFRSNQIARGIDAAVEQWVELALGLPSVMSSEALAKEEASGEGRAPCRIPFPKRHAGKRRPYSALRPLA